MAFTLAIVGRPNVGKSTLFNRLTGLKRAIVDDRPGVTRDRRYGAATLGGLAFTVIDTAGLEEAARGSLAARMSRQAEAAAREADAALFLIDARAGVTPADEHFARTLRKLKRPIVVVANKAEGRGGALAALDAARLGLGAAIPLSAEHGEGLGDLYDALAPLIAGAGSDESPPPEPELDVAPDEDTGEEEAVAARPLQLAIVGRPNVGKSTLVNRLLGQERLLTGPEAGITRDAIAVDWRWRGETIRLIDTAGLRRRAKVVEKLERLSGADTLRAIRYAQVVVLTLDAADMLEKQDLAIARHVIEEGRALVIAVNKWDRIEDGKAALRKLNERLAQSLPQVKAVPVVTLSALSGRGLEKLMPAVQKAWQAWTRRVPTGALNRWLAETTARHPPPLVDGRAIKLKYATQVKTRPPSFVLFASKAEALPEAYRRYLLNALGERFDLATVPLRLAVRRQDNPFRGKKA